MFKNSTTCHGNITNDFDCAFIPKYNTNYNPCSWIQPTKHISGVNCTTDYNTAIELHGKPTV